MKENLHLFQESNLEFVWTCSFASLDLSQLFGDSIPGYLEVLYGTYGEGPSSGCCDIFSLVNQRRIADLRRLPCPWHQLPACHPSSVGPHQH